MSLALNGGDVTKQGIRDINSIVSGWNYDILTSIITTLLMSWPFGDWSPDYTEEAILFCMTIAGSKPL